MLPFSISRGHNQTPKVASNYMPRTTELLHDMSELRVIFAVNG